MMGLRDKRFLWASIFALAGTMFYGQYGHAEEGGAGHYLPGSMASFMDTVPLGPTFVARLNVVNYSAQMDRGVPLPIAGQSVVDVNVDSRAYGLSLVWRPRWGSFGDKWSYAMSTTIPFVDMSIEGDINVATQNGSANVFRADTNSGLGDIVLMPVMLNYNANSDLNYTARLGLYAPTGDFEVGQLANTGKNYWTIEPTVSVNYFGQKNGREAQLFFGMDFNQENSKTHYKSGTQAHLDGTLAQHFPMFKGLVGVGVTAYWYKQLAADSGEGATFGDFKGEVQGVGPVLSYTQKLSSGDIISEFKWVSEFGAHRRFEGDTLFLKVMMKY